MINGVLLEIQSLFVTPYCGVNPFEAHLAVRVIMGWALNPLLARQVHEPAAQNRFFELCRPHRGPPAMPFGGQVPPTMGDLAHWGPTQKFVFRALLGQLLLLGLREQ